MTQHHPADPGLGKVPVGSDDDEKTLSLMGGVVRPEGLPEAADLDFQSMKGPNRLLSHGSLLIVMVFVVAAGSIYLMKVSQGEIKQNPQSQDVEARVEQWMAKLTNPAVLPASDPLHRKNMDSLFGDTEAIVAMFSVDMTKRQVPLEYVKKNPFAMPSEPAPVLSPVTPVATRPDHQAQKLQQELSRLELQTVMLGARPAAVISGEIVTPGQVLGSFTVTRINQFSVELQSQDKLFVLTMEKANDGQGGRGRGR